MTIANVSFTTIEINVPAGITPAAGFSAQLMLAGLPNGSPVVVPAGATSFQMPVSIPGNYTISLATVDTAGAPIGTPVMSAEFTVPATVAVPATITVTLS